MHTIAPLMGRAVAEGIFPYGEWALFARSGLLETGATEGEGGRWFDLASLTKPYTATALLAVAAETGLPLDASAGELLGRRDGPLGRRLAGITLRALLTHTARLPAWYPFYADGRPFFQILAELPEGGAGMVYSDIGYMLLREVLCAVTGLDFPQVIRRYVTAPLRIGELCFCPDKSLPLVPSCRDNGVEENMCRERGMAFGGFRPHFTDVAGEPNDGNAHYYFHGVSGHAGLFGTAGAVAELGRFYLTTEDPAYLGAVTPQPGCGGRCLAFHTGGAFPTGCGHTGFTGTSLWLDRRAGFGLALLTNRLYLTEDPDYMDLWIIFGRPWDGDAAQLPEDTALRRLWKERLLAGGSVGRGYGLYLRRTPTKEGPPAP